MGHFEAAVRSSKLTLAKSEKITRAKANDTAEHFRNQPIG